jgi:uracil-DNA glycosylase family 4
MIVKPAGCAGCPLETKGVGFCPDKMSKKPPVYKFVGEAPGKNEVNLGEPFIGKAGFVLKNWLIRAVPTIQLADEKGEIMYANTLRCLPPEIQGRPYPKGEERVAAEAHCKRYDTLPASIRTVVLFGDSPQRAIFGPELDAEDASDRRLGRDVKGVMGRVGREYEKENVRYVFAPHPAFILRQPSLAQHGQNSLKIAANTEKVLEPAYTKWDTAIQELQ